MPEELRVGSIVRVVAIGNIHYGMQGQVVAIYKRKRLPIRVWFGREADNLMLKNYPRSILFDKWSTEPPSVSEEKEDPRTWDYPARELRACPEWSADTLAARLYPN